MTLLESLVPLALVGSAIGGASAMILDGMGPMFVLIGALGAPVGLIAVVRVLCFSISMVTGRPYWPACTACGAVDFTYEGGTGPSIVRCACGRRYVRRGRQCRHVLPGGASRPHLRWRPILGWTDAGSTPTPRADRPYRDQSR